MVLGFKAGFRGLSPASRLVLAVLGYVSLATGDFKPSLLVEVGFGFGFSFGCGCGCGVLVLGFDCDRGICSRLKL